MAGTVEITGGADPILPTSFRIGETGAGALAAVGLAVSELWALRTGRRQQIAVDTRQATASLRSGHYLQMDGAAMSTDRNTIMGVYPARNGRWSYLHCNFPNHRAAALQVLGVPEDREAVRRAVADWDALALEEAIIAAKGAGGMVRSMQEWGRHPQAAAIASLPLLEVVQIGGSAPEALPEGDRPLSGVRVLDLTRVLAGPTCARTLAEHGADVLKITAAHLPNLGYQEYDTGHGKLSAYLDLREPKDVETMRGLVQEADVFSQGYRPGALSGLRHRLHHRLSDGLRRDGGAGAPGARGRQLARAHLAGADRPLDRRLRRGAGKPACGRTQGVRARGDRALVHHERHARRTPAPSGPGRPAVRDAGAVGPPVGAAGIPRAGLAPAAMTAALTTGAGMTNCQSRRSR
jgi:hypothetical protein